MNNLNGSNYSKTFQKILNKSKNIENKIASGGGSIPNSYWFNKIYCEGDEYFIKPQAPTIVKQAQCQTLPFDRISWAGFWRVVPLLSFLFDINCSPSLLI